MKALFLDRDGTINVDRGYVHTREAFEFVPGIFELCAAARDRGYGIFVITNQSGIERGMFTEREYRALTRHMRREFLKRGIAIRAVYHCPRLSGPDRKPAPGMFLRAQRRYGIDMAASVSVGDKPRDVDAGRAAGVGRNYRIGSGRNPFGAIIRKLGKMP